MVNSVGKISCNEIVTKAFWQSGVNDFNFKHLLEVQEDDFDMLQMNVSEIQWMVSSPKSLLKCLNYLNCFVRE